MTHQSTATVSQCAVLVGGLGTRLGTLTAATPKPLLPCGDRPFLAWLLRDFVPPTAAKVLCSRNVR